MSDDADYEKMKELVLEVVSTHFRPEFINRIDDLVVFHSLRQDQIHEIADIQINRVARRLLEQGIHLEVSLSAKEFLGTAGFDPVFGARPLKRAIQSYLETPLASEILAGKYVSGSKITVDSHEGKLVCHPVKTLVA